MRTIFKITDFAKRHFDPKFGGTKILDKNVEEVERIANLYLHNANIYTLDNERFYNDTFTIKVIDGYAKFCKLVIMNNFTDARLGSMKITLENYQYLRSGYSARTEKELPVLSRWFELPVSKPKADYLCFVLYDKKQIDKEARENLKVSELENYVPFDAEWGVVSIMGQSHLNEEKMTPVTMMRNALGIKEGGSGVYIGREKYEESVIFWSQNAIIK